MEIIVPKKLKPGCHLRVIAPSRSMAVLSKENFENAMKRFARSIY